MTQDGSPGPALQWVEAEGQESESSLTVGSLSVGRADENDIVLTDSSVSRRHARFDFDQGVLSVTDLESRNGISVNGEPVRSARLVDGDKVAIGSVTFRVRYPVPSPDHQSTAGPGFATQIAGGVPIDEVDDSTEVVAASITMVAPAAEQIAEEFGVIPQRVLDRAIVAPDELRRNGVQIRECEVVSLGGGIGSFVFMDLLRCSGMSLPDVAAVGAEPVPYSRYKRLCENSQIPSHERLRSNSDSCPDNIWGFPGYAPREVWRAFTGGDLRAAASALWEIFGEPAIAQTYTPRSGDVFASIDREAKRIGWDDIFQLGRIRALRKGSDGRYLVLFSQSEGGRRRHAAISARFVHLALGYPAIQMLPDLAAFREKHNNFFRVVNAYEDHEAVYEHLRKNGGTVLVRGRGIVASRVIQKLWEERSNNPDIKVIHLHRSRLVDGKRFGIGRRRVDEQFEFQPFNWPKACWGGELRKVLEQASPDERKRLLGNWGGTTTASRRDWRSIIREGIRQGWYRPEYGRVQSVEPVEDGRVATRIESTLAGGGELQLVSDFIIDCVGLEAGPGRSPVLNDLIQTYGVAQSAVGRLSVSNSFEIEELRHGDGRVYAAGAMTLGGQMAAVDSFLGLQFAGVWAANDMLRSGGPPRGLRRLQGAFSFGQWLKWARGVSP
jgi:pSer/pThr/pTyr-binding forkhead associated (FHA) protein